MGQTGTPTSMLMMLALLPGILILIYIFRKDKVESEPMNLIIKMVILGALSCIPAAFLESVIDSAFPSFPEGSLRYALMVSFLSAALMEEVCKFGMLRLGIFKNREFDYRFDGVVYGVCVAVGFAMLENVLYVMSSGLETAIVRAFLAVPLHAFCGVFMGAFVGIAKKHYVDGDRSQYMKYQLLAILVPILIHGGYDTLAFWQVEYAFVLLLIYVVILYILGIRLIRNLSREDAKNRIYPDSAYAAEGFGSSAFNGGAQRTGGFSTGGNKAGGAYGGAQRTGGFSAGGNKTGGAYSGAQRTGGFTTGAQGTSGSYQAHYEGQAGRTGTSGGYAGTSGGYAGNAGTSGGYAGASGGYSGYTGASGANAGASGASGRQQGAMGHLANHEGWKDVQNRTGQQGAYSNPFQGGPQFNSFKAQRPDTIKKTNGFSIASLVCGILSFLSMNALGAPAIAAVIFGIIGLKKRTPYEGKGPAIAGIVMGVISLLLGAGILMGYYVQQ